MNQNVTRTILDNMLALQPKLSSIGGQSHEEKVSKISQDIEAKIPDLFNMQEVEKCYPFDHYESMKQHTGSLSRTGQLLARVD